MTQRFEIAIIGGGPAGIAAAVCAAECGKQVAVIDDNLAMGGQIWRGSDSAPKSARDWKARLLAAKVTCFQGARVFDQPAPGILRFEQNAESIDIGYQKLILATGARERFLPFPGWTLPNVVGAGGLQALVKSGLPIKGKRVVIAGSGPLLLAVAAYLRKHGAKIAAVCEQAPLSRLLPFAFSLITSPNKLWQAMRYKSQTISIPFYADCWPVSAQGADRVEAVTLRRGSRVWSIECDYLACGFHLVPNTELPGLLGCQMMDGKVMVDAFQTTTVVHVFSAGESTGIGGVELALVEGQIAGYASAGETDRARSLFAEREKLRKFTQKLEMAFALQPQLRELPQSDTFVCRCEDVPYQQLKSYTSWRAAKLHTRCGMGPCQGRICGAATEFLFRWNMDSVRPPVFPIALSGLARSITQQENQ